MWIYILLLLIGFLTGLVVNLLSDFLVGRRYQDAVRAGLAFDEQLCPDCVQLKSFSDYCLWPKRCSHCGHRRWRVTISEVILMFMSFWLWYLQPEIIQYFASMLLMIFFGVVVVIDIEHRLILHPVSVAGAVIGLGFGIWQHGLISTLLGGLAGYGLMWGLFLLGALFSRLVARMRGENLDEVALGFGDVNLSGVLGLLLGWPGIIGGLILAILLGGMFSLFYMLSLLILKRYQAFTAIPYGPFLIASAMILLYFRDVLLTPMF